MNAPQSAQHGIDFATARAKMERYLASIPPLEESDHWIIQGHQEHDAMWLFWWNSANLTERKQRTGWAPGFVGNYPVGIRKADGAMFGWNALYPLEEFVDRITRKDSERDTCFLGYEVPDSRKSQ
jgi:hypothetical protein